MVSGALVAPVGQQHDIVAIEGLRVAAAGLDDDRAVKARLLLKRRMAVIPVGAALMDREAVGEGLAGRDARGSSGPARRPSARACGCRASGSSSARCRRLVTASVTVSPSRQRRIGAGTWPLTPVAWRRPAGDVHRHRSDIQREIGAAEDRRAAGAAKRVVQRPGKQARTRRLRPRPARNGGG